MIQIVWKIKTYDCILQIKVTSKLCLCVFNCERIDKARYDKIICFKDDVAENSCALLSCMHKLSKTVKLIHWLWMLNWQKILKLGQFVAIGEKYSNMEPHSSKINPKGQCSCSEVAFHHFSFSNKFLVGGSSDVDLVHVMSSSNAGSHFLTCNVGMFHANLKTRSLWVVGKWYLQNGSQLTKL